MAKHVAIVSGSDGKLFVDSVGCIVKRISTDKDQELYPHITRFDMDEYAMWWEHKLCQPPDKNIDVTHICYWVGNGYHAASVYSREAVEQFLASGRPYRVSRRGKQHVILDKDGKPAQIDFNSYVMGSWARKSCDTLNTFKVNGKW